MTSMQVIIPSAGKESKTSEDATQAEPELHSILQVAATSTEDTTGDAVLNRAASPRTVDISNSSTSNSILPPELRENFESVKALWRHIGRCKDGKVDDGSEEVELRRKQREKAVETAVAIDAEIARWQNGIAELEAMLAEADGLDRAPAGVVDPFEEGVAGRPGVGQGGHPNVRFPSLPPVIPLDDDDDDDEGLSGSETDSSRTAKLPSASPRSNTSHGTPFP